MFPAAQGWGVSYCPDLCASSSTKAAGPGEGFRKTENGLCFWKINILELFWPSCSLQCRTVKIAILGEEGVPVQVDGEAWIQPPGYIWIVHKNRAQTLTRDRVRASWIPCAVHVCFNVTFFWIVWQGPHVMHISLHTINLLGKNVIKLAFTTWEIVQIRLFMKAYFTSFSRCLVTVFLNTLACCFFHRMPASPSAVDCLDSDGLCFNFSLLFSMWLIPHWPCKTVSY